MSRARAFGLALGVLWVPHLLPFTQSWFTECDHCTGQWLKYFAVLPGFMLAMPVMFQLHLPEQPYLPIATACTTLALALALVWAVRRWPRARWWTLGGVALLAAGHAILLAHMFRM